MKKVKFSNESVLRQNSDDFLFTEVDGESVIMHIKSGKYFGLNPVSTDIWNLIGEGKQLDKVIVELVEMYDVDVEKCRKDTSQIIQMMLNLRMLNIAS